MATNDVPVAGGVQAIAQLLQVLGGTKSTSNTQLDTSALQGVLKQLQSQDYSQVLQQIFQQASTQIPRLQAAYGNATGGRSGNNSASAAALEKLLANITTSATSELAKLQLQNSGQQAQVAQALAQGSQRQTQQQGTNLPQAAKVVAALKTASSLYPLLKKGAGALGILGDGATAEGLSFSPNASFGELPTGTGGFGSLDLGGSSFSSGGLDLGNLDFGGSGSFGGFDGVDFGSLFNAGMDPFAGISFGDGGFDFGSFGNDMSIGIPSDSFSLGSEGAGLSLPSDISGYTPYLSAAEYLANPEKLKSALEFGEGNFLTDASQAVGLASTVANIGAASGAALGGLSSAAPYLGPLGAALSIAAGIYNFNKGPTKSQIAGKGLNEAFNQNKAVQYTDLDGSLAQRLSASAAAARWKDDEETAKLFAMLPTQYQAAGQQIADSFNNASGFKFGKGMIGHSVEYLLNTNPNLVTAQDKLLAYNNDTRDRGIGFWRDENQLQQDAINKYQISLEDLESIDTKGYEFMDQDIQTIRNILGGAETQDMSFGFRINR